MFITTVQITRMTLLQKFPKNEKKKNVFEK